MQDIDTSLVKLLAEERSSSLASYITNHDLYLAFEETRHALKKHSVSTREYVDVQEHAIVENVAITRPTLWTGRVVIGYCHAHPQQVEWCLHLQHPSYSD